MTDIPNFLDFQESINTQYFGKQLVEQNKTPMNYKYSKSENFNPVMEGFYNNENADIVFESVFLYHYKTMLLPLLGSWRRISDPNNVTFKELQRDICRWVTYRSFWQTLFLFHAKGISKSLIEFIENAKISNYYFNKVWHDIELNTITRTTRYAFSYMRDRENTGIWPNMELTLNGRLALDSEVITIVKPFNDEFWNTFYPPNDFGSMDSVKMDDSEKHTHIAPAIRLAPALAHNTALSGRIFTESHLYYATDQLAELDSISDDFYEKHTKEILLLPLNEPYSMKMSVPVNKPKKKSLWDRLF